MDKNIEKEIALFRYSLIAPAVANTYEASSVTQYLNFVASKTHKLPDGKEVKYSSNAIRKWYYDYKSKGISALYPKKRLDLGLPRALSNEAIEKIHEIKENLPYITGKAIYQKLVEDGYILSKKTSLSTIHRYIRENNLKPSQLQPNEVKAFEMEYSNDCWQADTTRGPKIKINGKVHQTYLIAFIDDASRMLLHAQFFFNDNAINMQQVFKKAISKYGVPKRLFVDNGSPYDNLQLRLICASLGVVLIHARPFCGASKGKIERVFRTIKDGWMNAIDWNVFIGLDDLNTSLNQYLDKNYLNSIHSSIKASPRDRFLKDYERCRFVPNEDLDDHFLHRKERKVNNAAIIKLDNKEYEVPQKYIKQKIQVRYLPSDMSKLYVFSKDNKIQETVYPVKKIDNSKIKRSSIDFTTLQKGESKNV